MPRYLAVYPQREEGEGEQDQYPDDGVELCHDVVVRKVGLGRDAVSTFEVGAGSLCRRNARRGIHVRRAHGRLDVMGVFSLLPRYGCGINPQTLAGESKQKMEKSP